ncbi:unnamed protein product [Amoebophrya sp. A25]|nr:unnamed protein product [Amoebophrya sp. A25]|eukprot:GSA25T00015785001.1
MTSLVQDAISGEKCDDTSQWDDYHRRVGNFAPKTKLPSSERLFKRHQNQVELACADARAAMGLDEVNGLLDVHEGDRGDRNLDADEIDRASATLVQNYSASAVVVVQKQTETNDDDETELLAIRRRRMAELQKQASRSIFGTLIRVRKADFVREVNQASCVPIEGQEPRTSLSSDTKNGFDDDDFDSSPQAGKGDSAMPERSEAAFFAKQCAASVPANTKCVWVVVLLSGVGSALDESTAKCTEHLARKFSSVKFVHARAEEILPTSFPIKKASLKVFLLPFALSLLRDKGRTNGKQKHENPTSKPSSTALPALFLYNRGRCQRQIFLPTSEHRLPQLLRTLHPESALVVQRKVMEYLLFESCVLESVVPRMATSNAGSALANRLPRGRLACSVGSVQIEHPASLGLSREDFYAMMQEDSADEDGGSDADDTVEGKANGAPAPLFTRNKMKSSGAGVQLPTDRCYINKVIQKRSEESGGA